MTSLDEVTKMTREDVAMRQLAAAAEGMRRLDREAPRVFRAWIEAQDQAREVGLVVDVEVSGGLSAHLSAFKQAEAREEGRKIHDQDAEAERLARTA